MRKRGNLPTAGTLGPGRTVSIALLILAGAWIGFASLRLREPRYNGHSIRHYFPGWCAGNATIAQARFPVERADPEAVEGLVWMLNQSNSRLESLLIAWHGKLCRRHGSRGFPSRPRPRNVGTRRRRFS